MSKYLEDGDYFWYCQQFILHAFAIYFFLFSANNPGFAEPSDINNTQDEESESLNTDRINVIEGKSDIELESLAKEKGTKNDHIYQKIAS